MLLFFIGWFATPAQADQMTRSPSYCWNDIGTGLTPWIAPNNAYASDNVNATVVFIMTIIPGTQTTNYLRCSNFGFTIPASARIDGIVVTVERNTTLNGTGVSTDTKLVLSKNAVLGTTNRATTTPYTAADIAEPHGGPTDVWGDTWTPAHINADNFGAALSISRTNPGAFALNTLSIDHISITVYYTAFPCTPPHNAPTDLPLLCQCDIFDRASLNPSTILGSNWSVTNSPADASSNYYANITNRGYLRLNPLGYADVAKAAVVPATFPAASNYVSVEFRHYAYGGLLAGADGMSVVFSDAAQTTKLGFRAGALGYSPAGGYDGFLGGWLGVGFDEYGNYMGNAKSAIGARGSGAGTGGYNPLGYTETALATVGTVPQPGYFYQVVLDSRTNLGAGSTAPVSLTVNRDSSGGWGNYAPVFSVPHIFSTNPSQAGLPASFKLSFIGASGGVTNTHEISALRICAAKGFPSPEPSLGGFNTIDSKLTTASATNGNIYTKLGSVPFSLNVTALNVAKTATETSYAISGNKTVWLDLFDDSTGPPCNSSAAACNACAKNKIYSQAILFTSADAGFKSSAPITLGGAYRRVIARASDYGSTACSTDAFAVRPTSFSAVSSSASNSSASGSPVFKAGADTFTLDITTGTPNYSGTPKINPAGVAADAAGWAVGSLSSPVLAAADSNVYPPTSSNSGLTYSEVGHFQLLADMTNGTSPRGIYDDDWTAVDQAVGDCVAGSFSNALDASGKYGCNFGIAANTPWLGRFVPDHFQVSAASLTAAQGSFAYMGQAGLLLAYLLEAQNAANAVTKNYHQGRVPVVNPSVVAEDQAPAHQGCELSARLGNLPTGTWANGVFAASGAAVFSRPPNTATALNASTPANCSSTLAHAAGPFDQLDLGLRMADPDAQIAQPSLNMNPNTSGTCSGAGCVAQKVGTTAVRFGLLRLRNAYGSPLLALDMPLEVQYWSGSAFLTNLWDSDTALGAGNSTSLPSTGLPTGAASTYFYAGNPLAANQVVLSMRPASGLMSQGKSSLRFTAPANALAPLLGMGFADVLFSAPGYLRGFWSNCLGQSGASATAWVNNPCARASFGAYKSAVVYRRENY